MPLRLLQFKPGIVKDITEYSAGKNGPYWIDCDKVRFRNGYPTKIGGWEKEELYSVTPSDEADYNTEETLQGISRRVVSWRAITDQEDYIAVGTSSHLYVIKNEVVYDITPLRATAALTDPFSTDGTTTVTVTDASHGAEDGDYVVFDSATAVGGIPADTLNRKKGYQITYVDANTYTIESPTAATSTATGGGSTNANYLIGLLAGLGTATAAPASGWGAGAWGAETWDTPRTVSGGLITEISQWSINLWGEDVLATVRNEAMYYWDLSGGTNTRAVLVSSLGGAASVPTNTRLTQISFPDRHWIAAGTVPYGGSDIDPMQVRWSDQEDFADWAPTATNTAGDQRLEVGTRVVSLLPTRDEMFISTDEAVYGMTFVGPPFTFSFRLLGTACGAAGKNVMFNIDSRVFWMGENNFFMYDGALREMNCPVQYFVYDRLNKSQFDKAFVAHNNQFDEISWFYVSTDNTDINDPEPDSYVTYNYREDAWSIGTLGRTCWSDAFGSRTVPFAFDVNGEMYNHETGTDDNGSAMTAYIESSPMEIDMTGETLMMVDKIIPNLTLSGSADVTVTTRKYPSDTGITKGPFTITPTTTKISMRARGRQMKFKVESDDLGDSWSFGDFRVNTRTDGMR